ncbi:MAG TPA: hypothetical protein VMZ29_01205 [Candidatus Bathyarchaeia archaeon]|nr:hypothetical protein [Candidatus Bathyarchaeia archaeon]
MMKISKSKIKKQTLFLSLLVFTTLFITCLSIQPSSALSDFISSLSDMEKYTVKELVGGITYRFRVESDFFTNDNDIGFAIYDNNRFREQDKLLTQDTPGDLDEEQIFTPSADGDYFLAVWMNEGDSGFVIITVWEDGTSNYMTVEELSYIFSLRWLWITLGALGGFMILSISLIIILTSRGIKKHQARVAEAREKGYALPRYGRKRDKCPFCNVKLPEEYLSQCPYCAAPITEE